MAGHEDKKNGKNSDGVTRRDFLKVLGASSTAAAVGCGKQPVEKIIPYLNQPNETIPGIANWYTGTCDECSAGCGVLVRVREGRVVKLEGNPEHPVNEGGLCARGQASLQKQYNPDRVREPLTREANGPFKPVSWEDALGKVAKAVKEMPAGKEVVFLTSPLSGSSKALVEEMTGKLPRASHVEYELFGTDGLDAAAEQCFGPGYRTHFDFSGAEMIVSFGAGFLETWNAPVMYSKQWSKTRKLGGKRKVSQLVHVEPRLSLTAANADRWLMNMPGSEAAMLHALLKLVVNRGFKGALPGASASLIKEIANKADISKYSRVSGISETELQDLAEKLHSAAGSLVVAGGASVSGDYEISAQVLANLINVTLGNVGKTVLLERSSAKKAGGRKELNELIARMGKKESDVGALFIAGPNLSFMLSEASGFDKALGKVPVVVSLSTELDETTKQSTVVLPASTNLEAWSDSEPLPGVHALNQPAMQKLYQTMGLGDTLLALGAKLGHDYGGAGSFLDYIKARWKARVGGGNFEKRWIKIVELGGELSSPRAGSAPWTVQPSVRGLEVGYEDPESHDLKVLAFPTVNSVDGSTANRPWLQELPDPLTTSVWGSWVEMHPVTAKKMKLSNGDGVVVRTEHGEIEAPLYETKHIYPGMVAVPIGQGHQSLGRYANGIGANPLSLLAPLAASGSLSMLVSGAKIFKATTSDEQLLMVQGSDNQLDRGIARWVDADHPSHHHGTSGHHAAGHDNGKRKQMYSQMEHPKYRWGMSVDLSDCTGCAACVVACYAENNVPVVGRELVAEGREMSWIRVSRYFNDSETRPVDSFMPMMCQHCGNAPCEPVCPVYATYHSEQGLNTMVYNRCVGTRYCSNNCSYKVRRFNWFNYKWPEPLTWQLNPDVTVRENGVMEKCSLCAQRIREGESNAKNEGRPIKDGEIQPACASSCPTDAITFGDLQDKSTEVSKKSADVRGYKVLDAHLNTQPAITYLARVVNEGEKGHGEKSHDDHSSHGGHH